MISKSNSSTSFASTFQNLSTSISSGISLLTKKPPETHILDTLSTKDADLLDILSEDEPPLIKMKKGLSFGIAGQILGKVRKTFLKEEDDGNVNLNPIMRDWLLKVHGTNCETLSMRLDNWIAEFLIQDIPILEQSQKNSTTEPTHSTTTSPSQTNCPNEQQPSKDEAISVSDVLSDEEEILKKYQQDQGRRIQEFVKTMTDLFMNHEYWQTIPGHLHERIHVQECIERYVLVKVFRKTCIANKVADFKFWQLLQTYQFIVPKHLDIRVTIEPSLIEECGQALTQMNFFKTPRNKLICLANCCISIFNYLEVVKGTSATIDEFLPILTYVVVKANPSSLISNIAFIEDFRSQNLLLDSWGYFLTNLGIVIDFIKHLDPKYLSTGEEISISAGNEWTLLTRRSSTEKRNSIPPKEEEKHETVSVDNLTFEEKYKFWNCGPEDITKDKIPELLQEYKRLVIVEHDLLTKPRKN